MSVYHEVWSFKLTTWFISASADLTLKKELRAKTSFCRSFMFCKRKERSKRAKA